MIDNDNDKKTERINLNKSENPPRKGGSVWIEFKGHRRGCFANPFEFPFKSGDIAIVEADRGEDAGSVNHVLSIAHDGSGNIPEFSVIRKATSQDRERITWLRNRESEALQT